MPYLNGVVNPPGGGILKPRGYHCIGIQYVNTLLSMIKGGIIARRELIDSKEDWPELMKNKATGKPFCVDVVGTSLHSLASADDVAAFIGILIKAPSSPHNAYNVGGPPTNLRDVAEVVRCHIPDAKIEFGNQPQSIDSAGRGIPWKLSMTRAREDFSFSCMPIEAAVLLHINDARTEAGLKPIKR